MKALQISGPHQVRLIDMPTPQPEEGEVLLRIRRAGFCGSDLSTYRGANPLAAYPRIPGHELAGTVESTGPGVPAHLGRGTAVLVIPYTSCGKCCACRQRRINCCRQNQTLGVQRDGGMVEFLCVPWQKVLAPGGLSFAELALVEPLTIGFHAIARGRVAAADTVVVLGCGAIGLGAIAAAAERGARVIAVDLDVQKLQLARLAGAKETINNTDGQLPDRLRALTCGDGAEVVVEAIGHPSTFRLAVEQVGFAGRVVYIGYVRAPVEYETKLFVQKELDILGSRNATEEDFTAVICFLQSKGFPAIETINRVVSLADAPVALRAWSDDPGAITKIQVDFPA